MWHSWAFSYNSGRSFLKTRKEHHKTMRDSLVPSIERISPQEKPSVLPHLIHLLQDTVADGASVGFLPPLSAEEAQQYWSTVFEDVAQGNCVLLGAREAGRIVGSVQLALATKANARHRAEVQKLCVLCKLLSRSRVPMGGRYSCSIHVREVPPSSSIARWDTTRWASFLRMPAVRPGHLTARSSFTKRSRWRSEAHKE